MKPKQGTGKYARSVLVARHLEVFVPKPRSRKQEQNLIQVLDELLEDHSVALEAPPDALLKGCTEDHLKLLKNKKYWENIIFGYSTYVTDGYFLQLKNRRRSARECWREQTLVLKFIVTNYQTRVSPLQIGLP